MISLNYVSQCFCLILVLLLVALTANPGEKDTSDFSQNGALFLKQYCFSCHAGDQSAAELSLDSFTDNRSLIENRDIWEQVPGHANDRSDAAIGQRSATDGSIGIVCCTH